LAFSAFYAENLSFAEGYYYYIFWATILENFRDKLWIRPAICAMRDPKQVFFHNHWKPVRCAVCCMQ